MVGFWKYFGKYSQEAKHKSHLCVGGGVDTNNWKYTSIPKVAKNVYNNIITNPKVETTQIFFTWWMSQ